MKILFVSMLTLLSASSVWALPQITYQEDYLDSFDHPFSDQDKEQIKRRYDKFKELLEASLGAIERSGFKINPAKVNVILSSRTSRNALLKDCHESRGCQLTISVGNKFGGFSYQRNENIWSVSDLAAELIRLGEFEDSRLPAAYHFVSFDVKGILFSFEEDYLVGLDYYPDKSVRTIDYLMETKMRVEQVASVSSANKDYKEVSLNMNTKKDDKSYFLGQRGHCGIYVLAKGQDLEKTLTGVGDHNCAPFGM